MTSSGYLNYTTPGVTPTIKTPSQQLQQQPQMPLNNQPNFNQSLQNFFIQPVGNIYSINTPSEINQVPAGTNPSIGLCLPENIMFIKSFQNGAPLLLGYRLSPIEGAVPNTAQSVAPAPPSYEERFTKIENALIKLRDYVEEIKK